MSKSKIEWTDATWNPVVGCTKIAAGCKNCYAERMAHRLAHMGQAAYWPTIAAGRWTGKVTCIQARLEEPLHWRKPRRIFVCSMGDLFHEKVPFSFIDKVMAVIALCPQHTFQILTKRPERMNRYISECNHLGCGLGDRISNGIALHANKPPTQIRQKWPFDNAWLGVSCSTQAEADAKIPILLQIPAAVRFVSLEPLLEEITLIDMCKRPFPTKAFPDGYLSGNCLTDNPALGINKVDQVIVGGESGPGARPMHPQWVRSIRDQCVAAGVPFFFKQWGQWQPWTAAGREGSQRTVTADTMLSIDGQILTVPHTGCGPADACELNDMIHGSRRAMCFDRVGKKNAGRILDGRTWDEYPKFEAAT